VERLGPEAARQQVIDDVLGKSPGSPTRAQLAEKAWAEFEGRRGRGATNEEECPPRPDPADTPMGETTAHVLDFLKKFKRRRGYLPTYREIAEGCELSSTSVADYHLRLLEDRGLVRRTPGIARGLVITGRAA